MYYFKKLMSHSIVPKYFKIIQYNELKNDWWTLEYTTRNLQDFEEEKSPKKSI